MIDKKAAELLIRLFDWRKDLKDKLEAVNSIDKSNFDAWVDVNYFRVRVALPKGYVQQQLINDIRETERRISDLGGKLDG